MKKIFLLAALFASAAGFVISAPSLSAQSLGATQGLMTGSMFSASLATTSASADRAFDPRTIRLMQGGGAIEAELASNPLYGRSRRLRDAGLGIFIASVVGLPLGAGLTIGSIFGSTDNLSSDAYYSRGAIRNVPMFASGIAIAGVSSVLFLPGVIMWIVGQAQMGKYENRAYERAYN